MGNGHTHTHTHTHTHMYTHTQVLGDKVTKLIGVIVFKIPVIHYKTAKQISFLSEE